LLLLPRLPILTANLDSLTSQATARFRVLTLEMDFHHGLRCSAGAYAFTNLIAALVNDLIAGYSESGKDLSDLDIWEFVSLGLGRFSHS